MSKKTLIFLAVVIFFGIPLIGFLRSNDRMMYQRGSAFDSSTSSPAFMVPPNPGMMEEKMLYRGEANMIDKPVMPQSDNGGFTPTEDRTIIRNVFMSVIVKDTRESVGQITQVMSQEGGFVTSSNIFEQDMSQGVVNAAMTLRVPVSKLDGVLEKLRQLADKVTDENITSLDATEQKIDLDAQIKNLQASETQLLSLMSKAQNVTQTLEVQRELSNVRGQIERLSAQSENLQGDANMATISLNISTKEAGLPLVDLEKQSISDEIRVAVRDAFSLYRDLFVIGLRLAILALPLFVLVILGYAFRFWQKKSKTVTQ